MSEDASKRVVAEARRQKLLARGKDRLQQITHGQTQKDNKDHSIPQLDVSKAIPEMGANKALPDTQSPIQAADSSLTRSQSLPQEATQPLESNADKASSTQQAQPAERLEPEQPTSPPPNTLWNTPRASDRDRTNTEAAKTFSATAEEQKIASWAKYDEHTADAVSTAGQSNVRLKRTSWHQAIAAAVQTTHLLRLSAAVLLVMTIRAAKSVMYSGTEVSSWLRMLVHIYDVPPLVLLTLLQLSAIFLLAKMYHDTPSTIPSKVLARVTSGIDESNSVSSTLKKVAMVLAPSLLSAFQQLSLARVAGKAVLDGTCVFLFAGILCHQINEA